MAQYTHNFSSDGDGLYVSPVAVVTPYLQVFLRAAQGLSRSTQDAVQDLLGKSLPLQVEVTLQRVPTGFAATTGQGVVLQIPETWHDHKIALTQSGKRIEPSHTSKGFLVWNYTSSAASVAIVAIVITVDYAAESVDSGPAKITVTSPAGQKSRTKFDLVRLK